MIRWREKFKAFAIHFALTLGLALIAAALIFWVWYPSPFHKMLGGTELFLLVVGIDLALGPLISLVIYDSRKSRRELLLDYSVVAVIQLAALLYGVYVVSAARPVYVAFVGDRFEVVSAADLADADLAAAPIEKYRSRPRWGPERVATFVPPEKRDEVLFSSLEGKDVHVLPRYYVDYETQLDELRKRAVPAEELARKLPTASAALSEAREGIATPWSQVGALPIRHLRGFWTVLVDTKSGEILAFVPVDLYEAK
jgi:hypothetical protein